MNSHRLVLAAAGTAAAFAIARRLTRAQRRWGTIGDEAVRPLPGDSLVPQPRYLTTRGISVNAPPGCIYPWLKQMGYQRGGLYSYDFLDRLFGFLDGPSAKVILPRFQDLKEGDVIPLGRGAPFPVAELRENESFVLADREAGWSWATCLEPIDDGTTRLITRNRANFSGMLKVPFIFFVDVAAFIMVRRWLVVLKQRAEELAADRGLEPSHEPTEERLAQLHSNRRAL